MKRRAVTMLIGILVILSLTGCQLAQDSAAGAPDEDRLVGVFLTTEYLDLFDAKRYMNDNLKNFSGGQMRVNDDTQPYQERLYATMVTRTVTDEETGKTSVTEAFVFPVPGIPYFWARVPAIGNREGYLTTMSDPAISDGHVDYKMSDDECSVTLTGTIYVSSSSSVRTYYFNPVYQGADGRIYALSGDGFATATEAHGEGSVISQTMDETTTLTEDGQAKMNSTSITVSISAVFQPEKIVVLQMNEENAVLSRMEYAPDAMPESISTKPSTAYFIVETHRQDDAGHHNTVRTIYGNDAESIETFIVREDGICEKHGTIIEH